MQCTKVLKCLWESLLEHFSSKGLAKSLLLDRKTVFVTENVEVMIWHYGIFVFFSLWIWATIPSPAKRVCKDWLLKWNVWHCLCAFFLCAPAAGFLTLANVHLRVFLYLSCSSRVSPWGLLSPGPSPSHPPFDWSHPLQSRRPFLALTPHSSPRFGHDHSPAPRQRRARPLPTDTCRSLLQVGPFRVAVSDWDPSECFLSSVSHWVILQILSSHFRTKTNPKQCSRSFRSQLKWSIHV